MAWLGEKKSFSGVVWLLDKISEWGLSTGKAMAQRGWWLLGIAG